MKCCFKLFKVVVIILTLINNGTGYTKLYQLALHITDTIDDIRSTESFADLVWIPFLIVQVSSTIFQCITLYCLFRELCEDNFMYKHCFKCCFILVLLIYGISVVPKSLLTIAYHNSDYSFQTWWKVVVDFFDSLLAGVTALGFQIILFMPVIIKTLRSAGACRAKVWPSGTKRGADQPDPELEDSQDASSNNSCCLFACCKSPKKNSQTDDEQSDTIIKQSKAKSTARRVGSKVKRIKDKGMEMKTTIEMKKAKLESDINERKEKKVRQIEKKLEDKKTLLVSKVKKQKEKKGEDKAGVEFEDIDNANGINENSKTAAEREMVIVDVEDDNREDVKGENGISETDKADTKVDKPRPLTKCKNVLCCCLENRTLCFIISMALANFHLFVYIAEVLFIFCFFC